MPSRKPTLAQTRMLLKLWLEQRPMPHKPGEGTATMNALEKRGWIESTDMTYTFPNGSTAQMYRLTLSGLRAAQHGFADAPLRMTGE